jgi:hypothetical protein
LVLIREAPRRRECFTVDIFVKVVALRRERQRHRQHAPPPRSTCQFCVRRSDWDGVSDTRVTSCSASCGSVEADRRCPSADARDERAAWLLPQSQMLAVNSPASRRATQRSDRVMNTTSTRQRTDSSVFKSNASRVFMSPRHASPVPPRGLDGIEHAEFNEDGPPRSGPRGNADNSGDLVTPAGNFRARQRGGSCPRRGRIT